MIRSGALLFGSLGLMHAISPRPYHRRMSRSAMGPAAAGCEDVRVRMTYTGLSVHCGVLPPVSRSCFCPLLVFWGGWGVLVPIRIGLCPDHTQSTTHWNVD